MRTKDRIIKKLITDYNPLGKVCLDLGPGSGRWLSFLKKIGPKKILSADFDKSVMRKCSKMTDEFFLVNFEKDKFKIKNDSIDLILITEVFEHIRNYLFFLQEIIRISKNGSLIIFTMPNICSLISRIRMLFGLLPVAIASDDTHVNFFRKKDLIRIFLKINQSLNFYNSSFSLNPLNPKSKLRIKSNNFLSNLDDSFIFTIKVKK